MAKNHPERKISPVNSGLSVAIWINEVETDNGPQQFRSITVSPRRYLDTKSGKWKDSSSYRPSDLPALLFAIAAARDYCYVTPLPGQKPTEPAAEAPAKEPETGEVPF